MHKYERHILPFEKYTFLIWLKNINSFVLICSKITRYYCIKFLTYLSGKYPHNILSFKAIEDRYLRKSSLMRDLQWRTIFEEKGIFYKRKLIVSENESFKGDIIFNAQQKLVKELDRKLFISNNAGIFSQKGIVYDRKNHAIVKETLEYMFHDLWFSPHFSAVKYQQAQKIPGISLSICSIYSDKNYAHFLFDSISKLYLARDLLPHVDNILIPGSEKQFQRKILDYLRLDKNLIWLEQESHLECEQLLFTSRISELSHACPWVAEAVRNLFLENYRFNTLKRQNKIIFASRKSSSVRKTSLEDMVIANLPNVEVIDFSDLSIEETIQVCQECTHFIGFHGAAFSNIVFCRPGTKVIEFHFDPSIYRTAYYYYPMAMHLGMNHKIVTLDKSMSVSDIKLAIDKNIDLHQINTHITV